MMRFCARRVSLPLPSSQPVVSALAHKAECASKTHTHTHTTTKHNKKHSRARQVFSCQIYTHTLTQTPHTRPNDCARINHLLQYSIGTVISSPGSGFNPRSKQPRYLFSVIQVYTSRASTCVCVYLRRLKSLCVYVFVVVPYHILPARDSVIKHTQLQNQQNIIIHTQTHINA